MLPAVGIVASPQRAANFVQPALPVGRGLDTRIFELPQRVPTKLVLLPALNRAKRVREINDWEIVGSACWPVVLPQVMVDEDLRAGCCGTRQCAEHPITDAKSGYLNGKIVD